VNYVDHPAWEVNHVWSLSLEEQFYLIWPLAFMVFGPRGGRIGLPVFLALAPVFRVAARVWFRDHAALGYSSTLTGMDSIAAGCLLALLTYDRTLSSQWRLSPPGYIKLGLLSAAVLVASAVLCGPVPVYHLILGRTFNAAAICLLIWSLANRADSPVGQFLHRKSVVVVGVLSYSLYLWQQLFLSPTRDDWYCRWPQNIGLALLAAAVSYIFIERPFLRLKEMP
jgi:peptidoglycan/LPS O-acetylase OafA/YrhL